MPTHQIAVTVRDEQPEGVSMTCLIGAVVCSCGWTTYDQTWVLSPSLLDRKVVWQRMEEAGEEHRLAERLSEFAHIQVYGRPPGSGKTALTVSRWERIKSRVRRFA